MIYIQSICDGIILGGVYGMVALGLALAYGVMGIINWAHGECLMASMFISYVLCSAFNMDPYLTLIVNAAVMFVVGYILQKTVFTHLLNQDINSREPTSILLSTAGMGIVLKNVAVMIFGSKNYQVQSRYYGKTVWLFGQKLMLSVPRSISFVLAILITVLLVLFLEKSETGRAIRAVAQDRSVASLMGMNVSKLFCFAMALSFALIGVAAALLVPNFTVYSAVGDVFSLKCFVIIILGGQGNVKGTLIAGIIIGLVERLTAVAISESASSIAVFAIFVLVLLFMPDGLNFKGLKKFKKAKAA